MKKAVGGKTRVDLAVDQIIQVILDRDMKAGDKLPNEYDLAARAGVGPQHACAEAASSALLPAIF